METQIELLCALSGGEKKKAAFNGGAALGISVKGVQRRLECEGFNCAHLFVSRAGRVGGCGASMAATAGKACLGAPGQLPQEPV